MFFVPMYTGATTNDEVRCDACHVQEQEEFSSTKVHTSLECTSCHNISDFGPDLYTHNATTLECDHCHIDQNETEFNGDAHSNFLVPATFLIFSQIRMRSVWSAIPVLTSWLYEIHITAWTSLIK